MRVALNLEQLLQPAPGGVGRYTATLATLLPTLRSSAGDPVTIVPFVARHDREAVRTALRSFALESLEPLVAPLPRPVLYDAWHVLGRPSVERLLPGARDADVLHAPSLAVPPRRAIPLVVTAHDAAPLVHPETFPRRGRWFHRRGLAAAARRADVVITVSNAAADELVEHARIPRERIRVVPNGVDLDAASDDDVARVRAQVGLDDSPYVFWVGSFEPRKNLGLLASAFARFVEKSSLPHRLVLAGPPGWVENEHETLAPLASLGSRVHLVGRVDDTVLRALFRGADLFVFPSRHEGFGLPVLEAMAQGTPVLCADIPALREVAADSARRLPLGDVDAWASSIEELVTDAAERARLQTAGLVRAREFSWERCVTATIAVYDEVLA
ncbi:MAG: glycosyltransferase family 4 protein [Acidimicrobiales bacterium]